MTVDDVSMWFSLMQEEKVGHLLVNQRGEALLHNEYLCEMLGLAPAEFKKSEIFAYLPKSTENRLRELLQRERQTGHLKIEFLLLCGNTNKKVKLMADKVDIQEYGAALILLFFGVHDALEECKQDVKFQRSLIDFQKFETADAGRILHDTIAQELYAIRMGLQSFLLAFGYEEHIQPIKGMLNGVITKTRDLSNNLRPSVLYDLGFTSAIDELVFNLDRRITCKAVIDPRSNTLSNEVHYSAYRIIQEMLARCSGHTKATHIEIDVKLIGRVFLISFQLDSCDFAGEMDRAVNRSVGVDIINNRVALYSGSIIITKTRLTSLVEITMYI